MKQIKLTQGYYAIVDDEDYEVLSAINWYAQKATNSEVVYARSKMNGDAVSMHRFIMGHELADNPDAIVDHGNRNGLDNRKNNLTLTDHHGNIMNRDWEAYAQKRAAQAMGVCYCDHAKKWKAYYRRKHLGWFNSKDEALTARQRAVEGVF